MSENKLKPEWVKALLLCAETSYIADDETKELLWSNDENVQLGVPCYKAFFGNEMPCAACHKLKPGELRQWEYYHDKTGRWLKVKNILFSDGDKLLRAGNFNIIDDAMKLSHESVTQMAFIKKELDENKRIKKQIEHDSNYDKMTQLYNRNKFSIDILSGRFDKPGTGALYFDLNNLKEVNDNYRHEAGDRIIICLANAITYTRKQYKNSSAYRLGGDEFLMLFSETDEKTLNKAKKDCLQFLADNQSDPACIVAIGEVYSQAACDAEKLVSEADHAMYENKLYLKGIKNTEEGK